MRVVVQRRVLVRGYVCACCSAEVCVGAWVSGSAEGSAGACGYVRACGSAEVSVGALVCAYIW